MRWTENPDNKVRFLEAPHLWLDCNGNNPDSKSGNGGSNPSARAKFYRNAAKYFIISKVHYFKFI
jgi:hypothetical protein